MNYPNYSPDLEHMAAEFVLAGGVNGAEPIAQVLCLVEEAGEAAAAYRRWSGNARRSGTKEEFAAELADVLISAYVLADITDVDLDSAVREKFSIVMSRPFKEEPS